jgi:hypothetical protein
MSDAPAERLLQFVIEQEACGQEVEVGSSDRGREEVDIACAVQGAAAAWRSP